MFIVALASLLFGYAIVYYAVDAMSHYDSASKTTKGLPLGAVLGLPSSKPSTANVFATWGASASNVTQPSSSPTTTSPEGA